jgi:hypothetical protein
LLELPYEIYLNRTLAPAKVRLLVWGRWLTEFCSTMDGMGKFLNAEAAAMAQVTTRDTENNLSAEEIAQRGERLYAEGIRHVVDRPENIGQIIAIDLNTGDYVINSDLIVAYDRLRDQHVDAVIWAERIGYDAVYAVGGTLVRTAQ